MAKKAFDIFLGLGRVARFERSDGWVTVETDPLRDDPTITHCKGSERCLQI